jgi:hypothetical protein
MMAANLRSTSSRATDSPPNPNALSMAVYGSSMDVSNGAVEGHTARAPVKNLGHGQKPPQLTGITRALRQSAKPGTVEILAKPNRHCHGKPPSRLPS